ncbi:MULTISPECIES: DUF459 domain-containing protein [unclassified Aureimonas]|uniref:SGNH/GDSL hydrolase family protein n=1 Tax=unclassified Aureimonas TaxID=2615206 RepID=UPI000A5C271C|nr:MULTISPECIES: SGNH family hydrolase [unclassified Aureimonas]
MLAVSLAAAIALPGMPLLGLPSLAQAQERPRTIMDMLFGPSVRRRPAPAYDDYAPRRIIESPRVKPRQAKPPRSAKSRTEKAGSRSTKTATARAAAATAGVAALAGEDKGPVEKSATAKTVLVVGDFMAASLAQGLAETLIANAAVRVENKADGSSGLVRTDHLDWTAKIGPMIEETKPAAVLVMVGSNDRQPITMGSSTVMPGTPEWSAEYARRADALAKTIDGKDVPLVWVGMPSFKFDKMSADMATFNEVYRKASAGVGGDFVDVWDGFVDASGAFSVSGPDIAGQQARLRGDDGVTMTPEGAEKLAFFAQKPLFRLLGTAAVSGPLAPGEIAAVPAATRPVNATSAPLVGLADPSLDGGDALLGGPSPQLVSAEPSPRQRLIVSGEPTATPIGRADNFNWSGKTEAVTPLRGTDDVISRGSVELRQLKNGQGIQAPKPMPSLADAILDDWAAQNATAGSKAPASPADAASPAATSTEPSPPAEPLSEPKAEAGAPISASPFAEDQTPR